MRECKKKKRNLLEKKIVTNKCLLRDKYNILIYWKEKACEKKVIYWWIKMRL